MVGTSVGVRNGILIKTGAALEMAYKITAVIFDKTGTLTHGKLKLTDFEVIDKRDEREFFLLVASAEKGSEHPLAQAIVKYAAEEEGLASELAKSEVVEFQAIPGTSF